MPLRSRCVLPRNLLPFALAALAACAGRSPDFSVHGVGVVVETDAPFARRPDLPARIESTIEVALAYWGGGWRDLQGSSLTLMGSPSVPCAGRTALGCYDGDIRISTRDPGTGTFACVEETVLVHEVGHAVIGDFNHEDPRWMQMDPVASALGDRVGYADTGEVACVLFPGVWRHPLGTP
jgi:hypothetical protein